MDKEKLPNYPYRDDALMLWDAIETHFNEIIKHYYHHDKDVAHDFELQDWIRESTTIGIGWQDGDCKGFPQHFESVSELVEFCTSIAFTASAQHAAVNFGQFETMKFVPNCPTCMRKKPHPNSEVWVTEQEIIDSLPNIEQSTTAIVGVYSLSSWAPDDVEETLLDDDNVLNLFTEKEVLHMQKKHQHKLQEIENHIMKRNADLVKNNGHPYTFLLPSRVTKSIAI